MSDYRQISTPYDYRDGCERYSDHDLQPEQLADNLSDTLNQVFTVIAVIFTLMITSLIFALCFCPKGAA